MNNNLVPFYSFVIHFLPAIVRVAIWILTDYMSLASPFHAKEILG